MSICVSYILSHSETLKLRYPMSKGRYKEYLQTQDASRMNFKYASPERYILYNLRGINGILKHILGVNHNQNHLKPLNRPQRVRFSSRHDKEFALFQQERFSFNLNFRNTVEQVDQRVIRHCMLTQTLTLVKGEESNSSSLLVNDCSTHHRALLIIYQVCHSQNLRPRLCCVSNFTVFQDGHNLDVLRRSSQIRK